MKDASTGDEDGGEGLSFAMLSKLIAEGRTEEVPVRQIPEGTNVSLWPFYTRMPPYRLGRY
jgi:hypothetical protein